MSNQSANPDRIQQDDKAPPVVENPRLLRMEQRKIGPRRIKGATLLMDDAPKLKKVGPKRMPPVPKTSGRTVARKAKTVTDQQERKLERREEPKLRERYVRLRLRVEGGEISVVGARSVEGPLIAAEKLHSGLVYEAALGKKRIGIGSIPDVGVTRSFPLPEGSPGPEGHFITELPSYEFDVRLPQKEISPRALPRLRIVVYRAKGTTPIQRIHPEPLHVQFGERLREVAQLRGIYLDNLSVNMRKKLQQALR